MSNPLYRQIDQLTLIDLDEYPIWEYLEEDDIHSKDECTMKGYKMGLLKLPENIVIKARFELNDGTIYFGFVTPKKELSSSQPVIIIENEHIPFWHGIFKPEKGDIESYYKKLSRESNKIFPIKWSCEVHTNNIKDGIINGFGYYASVNDSLDDTIQLVK